MKWIIKNTGKKRGKKAIKLDRTNETATRK